MNCGPLTGGGTVDLTEGQRALRLPWVRLHDCHWPNPDVVDVSVVFPRADADPERAESYDFARTDAYLAGIAATGARIVYRLGESIEHEPLQRRVHPPGDPARWARACAGIVAHCNEGWAGGARLGIPYWEIWNEPENRPAMWTGSDEQFFALYAATARTLRARFSTIKIGGPGIGAPGNFNATGTFEPSAFLTRFLDFCRAESLPLDFLSWHCYTDDPAELTAGFAEAVALAKSVGFTETVRFHRRKISFVPLP